MREMLSPSASCFASHWITDALAGDESLDFSVIKALVGVSTDSLVGLREATRERVALRCLQQVVSVATEDDVTAAAVGRMLNADATRSCEELLFEIIGQVGSSGSLEKDILPSFSHVIQKFIYTKLPALPETSFELLREVNPEIASMTPLFPVEQNGNNKQDSDSSLCCISHDHVNTDNLSSCSTDSGQHQLENLIKLVTEIGTTNVQKNPLESTPVFDQPCTSYSRCNDQHQKNNIGLSVRSQEKSPTMSAKAGSAKANCGAALLGSNIDPMPNEDVADHSAMLQPRSFGDTYPNPPHYNDGSTDTSLRNTFEASDLPEFVNVQDSTMFAEPHSNRIHVSSQHGSSEKLNQNLDDGIVRIQPVENDPLHDELGTVGVVPSVSCKEAIEGNKSETNQPHENATEHTKRFGQQNGDKARLEVTCTAEVNQTLHDNGSISKKNMVLHNKSPDADSLSEKNTGTNMADVQKPCCTRSVLNSPQDGTDIQKPCRSRSVPNSPWDGNKRAKRTLNKKIVGNTVAETSHVRCSGDSFSSFTAACLRVMKGSMPCRQDKDANDSLEGLSEQDLCVKCGKDGQLLKCSSCLLAVHDICFGSAMTFDDSGQFYCPLCYYTKATEAYQQAKKTYSEARKILSAFLGTNQHEQSTDKQPRDANREDLFDGCNTSKRKHNHHSKADNLSNKDADPGRQSRKQKTNSESHACTDEVVIEIGNKDCVVQNKRKHVHITEDEQKVENAEACEVDGNDNSFHEAQHTSQNRCSLAANQNVEVNKNNGLANSQECGNSDEIETSSSNDSIKRTSARWRNMRYHKARFQEKGTVVPNNSKKPLGCEDQYMPSPPSKRNYAYPPKRFSNPLAPAGRRTKLCWAKVEEETLKEAMKIFTPKEDGPIPWVQILEYGRNVFDKTRLPSDLRVKWRNMTKKLSSG